MDKLAHFPDCDCRPHVDHPAHALPGVHPFPDRLHLLTVLSNPLRWRSRYLNYWRFAKHVEDAGAILYTCELQQGDRHFEVTEAGNPRHLQLRTRDELWHKENMINLLAQRLPLDVKYFGWCDADLIFTRPDWAQETLHQLQHYDAVQMFSGYSDLTADHRPWRMMPSFMYNALNGGDKKGWRGNDPVLAATDYHGVYTPGDGKGTIQATGGAWAYRTRVFAKLGGLLDTCILGSADWHMALGLMGMIRASAETKRCSRPYIDSLLRWQERAAVLKANVGYVETHAYHLWHGSKVKRFYGDRWAILKDHHFDPLTDIHRDHQGLWALAGNKPKLRDAIRGYFRSRDEDGNELAPSEKAAF